MSRKDELKRRIDKKRKEIEDMMRELKALPERVDTINVYLHSSKEAMYEEGKQEGLSDKQLELFKYVCNEVKVTLSVNEDGEAEIIAVDDRQFKEEE